MISKDILRRIFEVTEDRKDSLFFLEEFKTQKNCFASLSISTSTLQQDFQKCFYDLKVLKELELFPFVILDKKARDYLFVFYEFEKQFKKEDDIFPFFLIRNALHWELSVSRAIQNKKIPVFLWEREKISQEDLYFSLYSKLKIRKFLFLESAGPILDPSSGKVLSLLAPGLELEEFKKVIVLDSQQDLWLKTGERLVQQISDSRLNFVLTSPNSLFKELFTIKGNGNLLRRKSKIFTYRLLSEIDQERLKGLMERAFRKRLKDDFWKRPFDILFLEEDYQGCAWLERTPKGFLLSKFAVTESARGIGVGRDIWDTLEREIPTFFWRGKVGNPINKWYGKVADGQQKTKNWVFFWKGAHAQTIPDILTLLENREEDFIALERNV